MEHYGFVKVSEEANYKAERLAIEEMIVETEGHLHVFVSNEGENVRPVYFDDLKIEQRTVAKPEQMAIRQQAMARSTSGCDGVNYLYNGIELNKETQLYETEFRGYDPALGRFMQIDPLAGTVPGVTGYNFGFNNPMKFKDPLGLMGDNSQDMFGRDRFDSFTGIYIPPFARGAHRDTSHEWAESLEANNDEAKNNEKTYKLAPYGTETRRKNGELISRTVEGYYLVPVTQKRGDPSWKVFKFRTDDRYETFGLMKGISEIFLGANASGYDDLRWVQSVNKMDFKKSKFQQFRDGDVDASFPFYYPDYYYKSRKTDSYSRIFDDRPGIYVNRDQNFLWTAELSLVGIKGGEIQRIFTLTYGFRIDGQSMYTFYPRSKPNPSSFHLNLLSK